MIKPGWLLLFCAGCALAARAQSILYQNDFQKAPLDQAPAEFLVLNGDFAVKESEGNRYLELPGVPLDTFGLLFGPATNAGVRLSARIYATAKGRRFPSFGVGLNGPGGYKLMVSPAKDALEICKGDQSLLSVPFQWKSGAWTFLRLQVRAAGAQSWMIEGKAWPQSGAEPKDWMISLEEKTAPHPGRAALWGVPYSGLPIRFDDLVLTEQ
ncbi:MAG: hypothetical protein ABSG59_12570 [Verrucomicrobiota bacterium]